MQIDLSVKHVTKKFKDFLAVDNVSFEVPDGQFFSILGPSGCGKTTLLRMIAGLTEPTEGSIEIRGQSMLGIPPNKRPVNLIFQHLALFIFCSITNRDYHALDHSGQIINLVKPMRLEHLLTKTSQALGYALDLEQPSAPVVLIPDEPVVETATASAAACFTRGSLAKFR